MAGSLVDPNPNRTYDDVVRDWGVDPRLAYLHMQRPAQPAGTDDTSAFAAPQSIAPEMSAGLTQSQTAPLAPAKIKPHFFDNGGLGWTILGSIGDAFAQAGGYQPTFWPTVLRKRQMEAEQAQWLARHNLQRQETLEDYERKRNEPRYFSGKEDQLSYDPATGKVTTVYDAPEEYETYAKALGYEPGSPDYRGALTDYVLRSYGPTAADVRSDLQDRRFNNSVSLEGIRQRNRLALKQTPGARPSGNGYGHSGGAVGVPRTTGNVYAPILDKVARGIPLTAGEQKVLEMRGGRRSASSSSAPTATGPGGKKVQWNGSAWVPVN